VQFRDEKPIKILLTSCKGQAALLDAIKLLPKNSEILAISEYRKSTIDNEVLEIDMSLVLQLH
jgi:hypothetical protein